MRQIVRRHTLQHGSGGLLKAEFLRNTDQALGWNGGVFGVCSNDIGVGDAVARLQRFNVASHLAHYTSGFLAIDEGKRSGIASLSEVHVNEVHANRLDLN